MKIDVTVYMRQWKVIVKKKIQLRTAALTKISQKKDIEEIE